VNLTLSCVGRHPNKPDTILLEQLLPRNVALTLRAVVVNCAVDFYCQSKVFAEEIENEGPNGMLPPKLEPMKATGP
jgi:hypothetical protein